MIDECARGRFDGSDVSDDLPDTVVMAAIVRQKWLVEIESDIAEEEVAGQGLMAQRKWRGYRAQA